MNSASGGRGIFLVRTIKSSCANVRAYNGVIFHVHGLILGRLVAATIQSRIELSKMLIEYTFIFDHILLIF